MPYGSGCTVSGGESLAEQKQSRYGGGHNYPSPSTRDGGVVGGAARRLSLSTLGFYSRSPFCS